MPASPLRVKRPASVALLLWERLPRSTRCALASRSARTPERAAALRLEAERGLTAALERAVGALEGASGGRHE